MDPSITRGLNDKLYDRRKAAALELEKWVPFIHYSSSQPIIDQLCLMFSITNNPLHTRNGGLIGLAATSIALGQDVAPFLGAIIPPILACFHDPESRVRYHACESLYNIAKVSKGEILVHFNEIFDALSKLAADSEMSVKNGAELLDRLLKDIVSEVAPNYVSIYPGNINPNLPASPPTGKLSAMTISALRDEKDTASKTGTEGEVDDSKKAFSLARFIPLLMERVYAVSPYTRVHLVSWLVVLDSVPDLELVAWLPDFLDGLLKYLADANADVRLATENAIAEFLREIKYIANVQEKQAETDRQRREEVLLRRQGSKQTMQSEDGEEGSTDDEEDDSETEHGHGPVATNSASGADDVAKRNGFGLGTDGNTDHEWEGEGSGAWVPGQGVYVDHAAIMDIMIQHLSFPDELVQSTAMEWILTFLEFAQNTVVSFTPRIVPQILPNLASPHRHIKLAAHETNSSLYRVIQSLPLQVLPPSTSAASQQTANASASSIPPSTAIPASLSSIAASPPSVLTSAGTSPAPIRKDYALGQPDTPDPGKAEVSQASSDPLDISSVTSPSSSGVKPIPPSLSISNASTLKARSSGNMATSEPVTPVNGEFPAGVKSKARPDSPTGTNSQSQAQAHQGVPATPLSTAGETVIDDDPFDVRETVNVLTLQFLSDHAETRIAALEWLLMLHLKAPTKILQRDSGTFPALLKTLSDPSEDVVKHDLQLLAQISASSEEAYFTSFISNVLELFSTDRRLLETRGSLIIRQLCLHLNAERIFRTIAEILEKDEDLEFASMMVVKLNMILITSPELADFRRRLKSLDSKDGQSLFSSLYRSWCHNAVAVFALCLLAQAYEHASNLLQIFAELELTVPLLVQFDKLVMLLESPIFTNLRLQLLEPEKYPYLPKCLFGLLMILPQSTAFVSLRARLGVVHSAGYVPAPPKTTSTFAGAAGSARSKLVNKDDIRWQELFSHFRLVQSRHEKARRQLHNLESGSFSSYHFSSPSQTYISGPGSSIQFPNNPPTAAGGGGGTGRTSTGAAGATMRRKLGSRDRQGSGDATASARSPLNPKRPGSGAVGMISPGVSIGGAVASMNGSQGLGTLRPGSPPAVGGGAGAQRRRLLGGMRRGVLPGS